MFNSVDEVLPSLRWLAENVHEWPVGNGFIRACDYFGCPDSCKSSLPWYEDEHKAARDLISGKPSWYEVPKYARWIAQDEDGEWWWFEGKPVISIYEGIITWESDSYAAGFADAGKVLGDCRKTLERRPEAVTTITGDKEEDLAREFSDETTPEEDEAFAHEGIGPELIEPGDELLSFTANGDMVNHPEHYQSDTGIQCIDAIRAALGKEGFIAYCRGQAIKYSWRQKWNSAEDQRKAEWYSRRAAEELE